MTPLMCAGENSLLPHLDYLPDGKHLLDTHYLHVDVIRKNHGGFNVKSATIQPMARLVAYVNTNGEFLKRQLEEERQRQLSDTKCVGFMSVMCEASWASQIIQSAIPESVFHGLKTCRRPSGWEDFLKDSVVNGPNEHLRGDGDTLLRCTVVDAN